MDKKVDTYQLIKPMFERASDNGGIDYPVIAGKLKISSGTILKYYSIYLRERASTVKAVKKLKQEKTCPTCGKYYKDVTDPAVCRDMIHYV